MARILISAEYMHSRRPWKSEKQHINEYLYKQGLPYRQTDMTNLYDGMQYVGKAPEPVLRRNPDGSIVVNYAGELSKPRELHHAKKRTGEAEHNELWGMLV